MSESTPSSNCVGPASPSPASPPDETTREGDVMSQSHSSQTILKPVRLTEQDYACLPSDTCKLLRAQDNYITCLEERLNSLEGTRHDTQISEKKLTP